MTQELASQGAQVCGGVSAQLLEGAALHVSHDALELGFELPFDLQTGELLPEVWRRWLAFDPVHACADHADALRRLELLHLECGLADEFHLQWGLRILARKLRALDVPFDHVEHAGGHRGLDHRYGELLPRLIDVLSR